MIMARAIGSGGTWRRVAMPVAIFAALAIVHTWPLVTDPATLSRNDNQDTVLNEWIVAWVAHQLPRDPLHSCTTSCCWRGSP